MRLEAHEAAMQRVVEEKRGKHEAINDKKKKAIEAAQRACNESIKSAEYEADQEIVATEAASESKLAASLLPLVSCTGLEYLHCRVNALDLEELRKRRPDLTINPTAVI